MAADDLGTGPAADDRQTLAQATFTKMSDSAGCGCPLTAGAAAVKSCCAPAGPGAQQVGGDAGCGCGASSSDLDSAVAQTDPMDQAFVVGALDTPAGPIPQVQARLTAADRRGNMRVRWSWGRMSYAVVPGLYALGTPDADSPVLVSANYKLSFDRLREALPGHDAWILVLDTKGINVWCAAGKGTFGTQELIERVRASGLTEIVSHRRLILPQLGAPGVAAHTVRKESGFRVTWGPVRADDIVAFLDGGGRATPEMRRVRFPIEDRAAVIPVELVMGAKPVALLALAFVLLSGVGASGGYVAGALRSGSLALAALASGVIAGAVLSPLLLPWIPGRAFALKGALAGIVTALGLLGIWVGLPQALGEGLEVAAWLLMVPAVASYLAMNFTGASTYTSLSGVRREMRVAVPLQIASSVLGAGLWIGARFFV